MLRIRRWIAALPALGLWLSAGAADIDWSKVDEALGKKGPDLPGGIHKYGLPRSDLTVTVDGVPRGAAAMVMGDLVLTDTEISPVMERLTQDGVEITAIHNHLLRTSVPVYYMHVSGHGDALKLAQALHAGLILSNTPLGQTSPAAGPLELDTAGIEKRLGYTGTVNVDSCSSALRGRRLFLRPACRSHLRWALPPRSTSSPRGKARRQ